jgi:1-acyl-sn-glycerol-3-phosphate acyltransferase
MTILRKIWTVYAVLLFLTLMALSFPVLGLNMILSPGKKALRNNIRYLHHVFTPVFLTLIGIRLDVSGKQHLDPDQSYVIVGNHRSSLDFIVNAAAFPGIYRYLAKQELLKIPVFGWVVKKMCLIVDRGDATSRSRSVAALGQALNEGWSIFIYPEGSRNAGKQPLAPFYDGAFRIAVQTGAPVAVQTLVNMQKIAYSNGAVALRPGKVRIVWDAPIPTTDMVAEDIPKLKERVRDLMAGHLEKRV